MISQSTYVRDTVYSAAATGMRARRSSSRRASFLTASGMPAASIFSRSSSISLAWSSPSPSSRWMAFICSRRKYSRWFLPTSDCTCDWIFEPSSRTSSSLIRMRLRLAIRSRTSSVSSTSCLTAVPMVLRLDTMKSARRPGSVMLSASVCRSSESSGDSDTTCWKFDLMLRSRASISSRSSSRSGFVGPVHVAAQVRLGRRRTLVEVQARQALDDEAQAAVGQLEHLVDVRRRADGIEVLLLGLLDGRVALREDGDELAAGERVFDQADRALAGDRERHERMREQHRVPQRQDRQLGRNRQSRVTAGHVLERRLVRHVAHLQPLSRRAGADPTTVCRGYKRRGGAPVRDQARRRRMPHSAGDVKEERRGRRPLGHQALAQDARSRGPVRSPCSGRQTAARAGAAAQSRRRIRNSCRRRPLRGATSASSIFAERLGLHLDQGEFDVFLDIRLGALARVVDFAHLLAGALGANATDLLVDLTHDFAPAVFEQPS